MPKAKGSPKTGGRQPGSVNKQTAELKAWGLNFLNKHTKTFDEAFASLESVQKLEVLASLLPKLLPYYLPKQSEAKFSVDDKTVEALKAVKEAQDKVNGMFKIENKQG